MTTDKTSTAPVMSLRDTYERLRSLYGGSQACLDTHMTDHVLGPMIDSITPYLGCPSDPSSSWIEGTIVNTRANSYPGMHVEVAADIGFTVNSKVWLSMTPPVAPTPDVVGGDVVAKARDLFKRLRDTPNWLKEPWGDFKSAGANRFDRAPFEAADLLETLIAAPRVQGDAVTSNVRDVLREMRNEVDDLPQRRDVLQHYIDRLNVALTAQPKGDASHPAEQTRGEPLIVPQLPHGSDRNPLPDFSSFRTAIDEFVNRFLSWELPDDVCADPVACKVGGGFPRYGTNLLTHAQAKVMIERVLMPPQIDGWFAGTEDADGNELVTMRADDPRLAKPETGQTRGDGVDAVSYTVEAVAEVVRGAGGQNKLSFVVEGAEASLEVGTMLYAIPFMTPPDDGSVELYDAPRQAVPDGWQLVPIALDEKMKAAWMEANCTADAEWEALLAASPSAGRMGVGS